MPPRRLIAPAAVLLSCAVLAGSCDRSPPPPAPAPATSSSIDSRVKAGDAACALPLEHFAPHKVHLTGSILDYPSNLVLIDRTGRLRWNSVPLGPRLLGDYIGSQARIDPPPILVIEPTRDAPCAVVRETLAMAIQVGRCSPARCAFQWPGDMAPPPPPSRSGDPSTPSTSSTSRVAPNPTRLAAPSPTPRSRFGVTFV